MAEAPESPPETSHHPLANPSFSSHLPISHESTSKQVNGDPSKVSYGAPGSSWSTKKFRDEYERTFSALLDQNWDPGEFTRLSG